MSIYTIDGTEIQIGGGSSGAPPFYVLTENNLISHRGKSTAPENTLIAIEEAALAGLKHVEVDVAWTSDNIPVLLHDTTIDRTSNGSGSVSTMTFDQLQQYDFGSWKSSAYAGTKIPSLKDALNLARFRNLALMLDITGKTPTTANLESMVAAILGCGMLKKVTVCTYINSSGYGNSLLQIEPRLFFTIEQQSTTLQQIGEFANKTEFFCLSNPSSSFSEQTAKYLHDRGWYYSTWTIGSAETAKTQFLGGVDWIISNSLNPNDLQ